MSEITRGAIGMPFEMAMSSELSRRQFHSIAQALLKERDQLEDTIAQQAQMIEHLRGGPTPGYTALDMTTAAAQGFRDGAAKLKEAYRAGWDASGEGWNAEYPGDTHEHPDWVAGRDKALEEIMQQVQP